MGLKDKAYGISKIQFKFNYREYIDKIANAMPDILKSPLQLLNLSLRFANMFIEFIIIFILVGQTVHILSGKERKIVNMRHLLVKWTIITIIYGIRQFAKTSSQYPQVLLLIYNMMALALSYPSKLTKNIYIKIFAMSEKKKNDDFIQQNLKIQDSLSIRMMVSFTLFLLNLSKIIVTFIPIQNRKPIQESIKGLNLVIVEEKYFWKLYQNTFSNSMNSANLPSELFNSGTFNSKAPVSLAKNISVNQIRQSNLKSTVINKKNGLRENKIQADAQEMILINFTSTAGQIRKFSVYRSVKVIYYVESSELILVNDEDKKTQAHAVYELQLIQEDIVQFICEDEAQPILIKFKNNKDKDEFINTIHLQNLPS